MNKFFKKLMIGATCGCMLLTGGLALTGCSLSEEQQTEIRMVLHAIRLVHK